MTYQLASDINNVNIGNNMFDIVVRKAKFISFYVGDVPVDQNISVQNFSWQNN